jgi:hypothetical protein
VDAQLRASLGCVADVVESPSMFGAEAAWWCNAKEIAHVEAPGTIDIRLTRSVIRDLRPTLRADARVVFRRNRSDWIEVRDATTPDVAFVVDLVGRAAAAHRPPPGESMKPPPTGAELERRRRFH